MPHFENVAPETVHIGRKGPDLGPYITALAGGRAGIIHLENGDTHNAVKRSLQKAAKLAGVRIRVGLTDDRVAWKVVGP